MGELTRNVRTQKQQMTFFTNKNVCSILVILRASQVIAEEGRPLTNCEFIKNFV